jgi:hypothetical protein
MEHLVIPAISLELGTKIDTYKQGIPYQFYEGTVSSSGQQMSGEFHTWNSAGGASMSGVDFSFSATKR